MKVAVIGGGSTYTPELINGFILKSTTFPLTELVLMDIDEQRLEVVGGFAKRIVTAKGNRFRVTLSTNQREAIKDAQYIITQLRVGMMDARRKDEYLGYQHGLVGQETTGIGGMAKALRTIPVLLRLVDDMRSFAPGSLLVNFTNPAGLITEAVSRYAPDILAVGVCNVPITTQMQMADILEHRIGKKIDRESSHIDTLGLNHLSWHRGFKVDGEEMWPHIMAGILTDLRNQTKPDWDPELIETLDMLPNYYLQYYYYTAKKLAEQANWPPSRAEQVMEIERDLLQLYAKQDLFDVPEELTKRGGANYSLLATQLLNAHYNDSGERHVVNICHQGNVSDWPSDWVLEMPATVNRQGIHPIPAKPLPPVCYGLLTQIKMFELLTIEAALHGDRKAAYEALLVHPLGPTTDRVQSVLDAILATNRPYLPQFWE